MYPRISKSPLAGWLFLIVLLCGLTRAPHAMGELIVHQARFSAIHYQEPGQLERFTQKVKPGALTLSLNQIFMGNVNLTPEAKAGRCVDQLFLRVQAILEMVKPDLKVEIRLFQDQASLSEAFEKITGKPTKSPAFYWKETNTIHLHLEQISSGILAHEMAHAVIANYFLITPPGKVLELLCQYVDREVSMGNF